jgi:hypothetical protein
MLSDVADSCLFVTPNGAIVQVYCEFHVMVLTDVHTLWQGQVVAVSAVCYDQHENTIFYIQGHYYYSHHFVLIL